MLKDKNILLGVTGGIAAYKAADLTSRLVRAGAGVDVILTENAEQFITPLTFESLCHRRVVTDTFDRNHPWEVEHIALAEKADALLIAPATANTIAKLANGLADNMLTTTALAYERGPKLIAPAMNTNMYENTVTQENLERLRHFGWTVLEPDSGVLACGTVGRGRLPDPAFLVKALESALSPKDLSGKSVLVTAGPTWENIDPVRYITNHSTGRMGYAIAEAAAMRGADVTLVSGPVSLPAPYGVRLVNVVSAEEMFQEVTSRQEASDIIIKAAAVADYRPEAEADHKIKKTEAEGELSLPLQRTKDILSYLGTHRRPGQFLCGFSMETENLLENSRKKLEAKHVDMIAANSLRTEGAGFGTDTNVLTLITKDSELPLEKMSKREDADRLLDEILKRMKK